jgi:hypothetical protein
MDRLVEEQLKRIQELATRMSGLEHRAVEITEEIVREARAAERNPLREVRDLRAVESPRSHAAHTPPRSHAAHAPPRGHVDHAPPRGHGTDHPPRRRRRRKRS